MGSLYNQATSAAGDCTLGYTVNTKEIIERIANYIATTEFDETSIVLTEHPYTRTTDNTIVQQCSIPDSISYLFDWNFFIRQTPQTYVDNGNLACQFENAAIFPISPITP